MSYAALFAGLMLLWPLMAALGAQGYTPLLALAGLAGLAYLRPAPPRVRLWTIAALVLVFWLSLTSLWSPAGSAVPVSGSLGGGDFAVEASWVRLVTTAALGWLAITAALRVPPGGSKRAAPLVLGAFALHFVVLVGLAVWTDPILAIFYPDPLEALREGEQNVIRNANAFALALPLVLSVLWAGGYAARAAAFALAAAATLIFVDLGAGAAVMALGLAVIAMLLVGLLTQSGFRWLFGLIAASILVAPLVVSNLARLAEAAGLTLPFSAQSRAWSWQLVGEKIAARPVSGHGLEAAGTWTETYAEHPNWLQRIVAQGGDVSSWSQYRVIPGHPHNMALEIWAETGAVGAVLASLTLVALAWRLPMPREMPGVTRLGLAGLAGAAFSIFSFAYSAWNEAFWASLVLVAMVLILLDRAARTAS